MTHWYSKTGAAVYQVPAKRGGYRDTTLRDAREQLLLPGLTGVIDLIKGEGLLNYFSEQILLAALTLPRRPDEPEAEWLERVRLDAKEAARRAADRGTRIHSAIENGLKGIAPDEEMHPYVQAVKRVLEDHFGAVEWECERSWANVEHGYGCKIDLAAMDGTIGVIVDVKTTDKPLDTLKTWPNHHQQLAGCAQARGFGLGAHTAICYVHRAEPGAVIIDVAPADLRIGWECLLGLLQYWRAANKYDPRQ